MERSLPSLWSDTLRSWPQMTLNTVDLSCLILVRTLSSYQHIYVGVFMVSLRWSWWLWSGVRAPSRGCIPAVDRWRVWLYRIWPKRYLVLSLFLSLLWIQDFEYRCRTHNSTCRNLPLAHGRARNARWRTCFDEYFYRSVGNNFWSDADHQRTGAIATQELFWTFINTWSGYRHVEYCEGPRNG